MDTSAHRRGANTQNDGNDVNTATSEETAAVSRITQMIKWMVKWTPRRRQLSISTAVNPDIKAAAAESNISWLNLRIKHASTQTPCELAGVLSARRRSRRVDCRGKTQWRLLTVWPCQVRSEGSAASWRDPYSRRSSAFPGRMPGDTSRVRGGVEGVTFKRLTLQSIL